MDGVDDDELPRKREVEAEVLGLLFDRERFDIVRSRWLNLRLFAR